MDKKKPTAGAGRPPAPPRGGGGRGKTPSHGKSPSPGGASASSASPASAAKPVATGKKPPSDKAQARYKRDLTREINSLKPRAGNPHTPDTSRLLAHGRTAQELGRFHEQATRELWQSRAQTLGAAPVAQTARASQSRLGSALSVPELHSELAPPRTQPANAKGTQRQSLRIGDTHVAIPTDHRKLFPEYTVSLKDKGGRSTAYPVMAIASVHPAQGRAASHKVLTTLEAQRSGGRDAVSTLSKGRLLQRSELAPADAIAVDKHGTYELPGAQATGSAARAHDVIARNTGTTIEQYGRSTSPRGRRLFGVIETLQNPTVTKRKRQDVLIEGSRILTEIEPDVFDARRSPPGSPDYRAAARHFGLTSPTPASSLSSMPAPASSSSSSRALSPLRSPPTSLQTTQTTPSSPLTFTSALSPAGTGARKMARRDASALATPIPTSGFPAPTFSLPTPALHSPSGPSHLFSSSSLSAFSPPPRAQPPGSGLSSLSSPRPGPLLSPFSRSGAGGPSGSSGASGQPAHGPGGFQPFPHQ